MKTADLDEPVVPASAQNAPAGQSPLPGSNAAPSGAPVPDARSGNVSHSIQLPSAGDFAPASMLSYNIQPSPISSVFGTGWANSLARTVTSITSTIADLTTSFGATYRYTGLSGGTYEAPPRARNSLQTSGSGWVETQPDHSQFNYDSSGQLTNLKNAAGQTWTLTYGSGKISTIRDPFSRLTTYTYDGS